eukprot:TRINITY_DN663_c0_g1_i4.p1 TRINITY_DN663_c0_g1~~TRINITY_DN663_c0_g1_i4.p1  ORF type:complete len:302 (+),score=45.52 TRINITY_DN663_c0_g1_i4:2-907(+)
MSGITRIFPYLYLCSHKETRDKDKLLDMHITHIVALGENLVSAFAKAQNKKKGLDFEYLVLDVNDSDEENVIQYFDKVHDFIQEGKNHGYILVHCPTGDSRAAVMCAAYLIKFRKLSVEDACGLIQDIRPTANFRPGFMKQLNDYYNQLMGPVEPPPTPEVEQPQETTSVPESSTQNVEVQQNEVTTPSDTVENSPVIGDDSTINEENADQNEKQSFTCYKCRTPIFTSDNLAEHTPGKGQTAFKWTKRGAETGQVACSSYFLDEMEWMGNCSDVSGKLFCPKCNARIGSWDWSGSQCSCG